MSPYRSILLHVDATAESATRLQVARDLAERHGAAVTALFGATTSMQDIPYAYSAGAAVGSPAAERRSAEHDAARAHLQRRALGDGPEVAWFDVVGDSVVHGFIAEAAYADLLVLGQQAPGASTVGGPPAGFVESAIIESGRPALVIPRAPAQGSVGRRALVAWNGSAQAARALTAALPLLEQGGEVHVVTWSGHPAVAPHSGLGIGEFLQRHGIVATLHRREPSSHVGAELIAMAQTLRADLVVMGCYGRSRARERVLGGATRSVLGTMPVPMLMVH